MINRLFGTASVVLAVFSLLLSASPSLAQQVNPTTLPTDCFVFTSFRGNGDGLHLSWSSDGLNWAPLNNDQAYIIPTISREHLMRDPCIVQGPDGMFHLVWTTGWTQKNIGYASSKDLIHWSEQKLIPVMEHEETARNSWAPELYWNKAKQEWIIFWATTIPGRFKEGEGVTAESGYNHRIYSTTTKDFVTFTPTKLFLDPKFNVIDATMFEKDGKFHMIVKDETPTPPKKNLRVVTGDSVEGPWTEVGEPFTPQGMWVEGPSVIKIGEWFYCYFDMYRNGRYGAMRSKDLKTWEDLTDQLKFNVRNVRHGTALKVSRDVVANLLNSAPATTQPGGRAN